MVPSGWDIHPLEYLAQVERGKFSVRPRNDPRYFGGTIPFVQTGDVTSAATYLVNYSQTLNEDGLKVSKLFSRGTILITIAANIGETAITTFDVACPDSVVAIQPYLDKTNTYWLKKYLETKQKDLDSQATQNAQKNINLQVLKPLLIRTPPLPEQNKIAQILSTWDKAITTTEQLLVTAQHQKKALMQQLLTGKKRLLDDNGVRFSGEWKKVNLVALCDIKTGKKDVNEGNPNGIYPFFTCASKPTSSDSFSFDCEALLIAGNGMLGKTHYYQGKFEAYQRTYVLLNFEKIIKASYLHQYILYWLTRDIEREKQHGAMPYIKLGLLENFKILLPSIEEQHEVVSVLSTADIQIEILQKKLAYLKQEKKALMQQLLTGKRRVQIH